jgi:nucleotidyltransferase substrate binding protein (TIGR01987 family)
MLLKDLKKELWLAMLADRNSTSHIYSEALAVDICNNIIDKYVDSLEGLIEKIKTRFIV